MKKILTFFLLVMLVKSNFAQFWKLDKKNHVVNKTLEQIIHANDLKNAGFAFLAVDLNSGETVASYNPDKSLKPASTHKLFSTATVLELYGPDYQFETKLFYSGSIDTAGILEGNIIIKGGGDPSLGSKYFDTTANKQFLDVCFNAIKDAGIDSIAGRIIADASIYSYDMVPTTWSWQDMGNYYGAGACGLTVYDNKYSIYFSSGDYGEIATIDSIRPDIPGLEIENRVMADSISYDNAYIFGAPYSYYRYVRGAIPVHKTAFDVDGSMPDPAYFAAYELEKMLNQNRIGTNLPATTFRLQKKMKKPVIDSLPELVTLYSPKLSEIITETNVHSINLYAEHCVSHSGLKLVDNAETYKAANAMEDFWEEKGMDIQGISLTDGSGLSHYNGFTPRQMVFLLNYMKNESEYFDHFYNSMAIAGETGTLKRMFQESIAKGQLRAKSGTINRVKAYAGYVTSTSGREIAFSMVVNNFSCSSGKARSYLEQLMNSLAELDK